MPRIKDFKVIRVTVPFTRPVKWAWGVRRSTTRHVVVLETDSGLTGYGETMGDYVITEIMQMIKPLMVGLHPWEIRTFLDRVKRIPYYYGYLGYASIAGLEMAMWDLWGKCSGLPVYELLGGIPDGTRPGAKVAANLFYDPRVTGKEALTELLRFAAQLLEDHGFSVIKYKSFGDPDVDVATMKALRREFGSAIKLRIDPNGAWDVPTAIRVLQKISVAELEYAEDPTSGIEAMSRVRAAVAVPLSTNMCVTTPDEIPTAVRLGAVDIILGDCHKWGGILRTQELAAVCSCWGLGMSMHSSAELGISTAAYLHCACALGVDYAIDSHLPYQADDVVVGGQPTVQDGFLAMSDQVGLGVEVDWNKLAQYRDERSQGFAVANTVDARRA
jgi:glucarate dehydratase